MHTFNTQFPIDSKTSIPSFIELIKKWQIESPHSTLPKETLSLLPTHEDSYITGNSDSLQIIILNRGSQSLAGARHTTTQDSIRWTTEIVGSKKEFSFWVSIQVSCDNSVPTHKIPTTKKPHIIKTLLSKLGGGSDGDFETSINPVELNSKELKIAADVINGESANIMPVVYVSADSNDSSLINTKELAYHLSGMAHVVIEPNRDFSLNLRHDTNHKNAFEGAIAIYWPEGLGRYLFLPWGKYENPKTIESETKKVIRSALLSMRPLKDCNWQYIIEQKTKLAIEALKSSGSTAIDEYIDIFDAEISSLKDELSKLERENARLKSQAFSRTSDNDDCELIVPSSEKDLYPGEHQDLVLEAIESYHSSTPEKYKRRKDVLQAILQSNTKNGSREEITREIKDTLSQYQKLDDRTKRNLERLGFSIEGEGTHYKLTFQLDSRYPIILAKTPSDHRAGKNTASDINAILF
ncbi:hypothetical protein [Pseudomonas nitroreducens]|uniref:hypothetical protein n=1 Tax=Pseudomonas nitroreducens TaxID=46680 RepID=UPI0020A0593A|nr:hypothetical protein [Pseudomonas nitroreducens]MCP1622211.1 hypothetical protein [Pseudomonas nitroreducens]